jgi:hypothetical protein
MAKFLNTSAINYYLEELIKAARERLIRIRDEVRLSAETIAKGEVGAQTPSAANSVEDKPYDKLTTSKLAKGLAMRTGELNDELITAGLLTSDGDQFKLTDQGKAAGGEFRFSKESVPFFIWLSDLAV